MRALIFVAFFVAICDHAKSHSSLLCAGNFAGIGVVALGQLLEIPHGAKLA